MVDMVVHRHELRATLSKLCSLLMQGRNIKRRAGHMTAKPSRHDGDARAPAEKPAVPTGADLAALTDPNAVANDVGYESGTIALPPPERKAAE